MSNETTARKVAEAWRALQRLTIYPRKIADRVEYHCGQIVCKQYAYTHQEIRHTEDCPIAIVSTALHAAPAATTSDLLDRLGNELSGLTSEMNSDEIEDVWMAFWSLSQRLKLEAAPPAPLAGTWSRDEAIKAEREACAKIAGDRKRWAHTIHEGEMCEEIAAAIRAGNSSLAPPQFVQGKDDSDA